MGIKIKFKGKGIEEIGVIESIIGDKAKDVKVGQEIVKIDKRYFRPSEVDDLLGDATKAINELGWKPKINAKEMCIEMVEHDFLFAQRIKLLRKNGFNLPSPWEK